MPEKDRASVQKLQSFDDVSPVFVKKEKGTSRRTKTEGSGGSRGRRTTRRTIMSIFFDEEKTVVSFGDVSVREFRRTLSKEAVPSDGGYPLGLSNQIVSDYTLSGSVDDFEHRRQEELKQRYIQLVQEQRKPHSSSNNHDDEMELVRSKTAKPRLSRDRTHKMTRMSSANDINAEDTSEPEQLDSTQTQTNESSASQKNAVHPVKLPPFDLETRQYDYCRKRGSNKAGRFSPSSLRNAKNKPTYDVLHSQDGNNPLFGVKSEEERKEILERNIPEHFKQNAPELTSQASFNASIIRKDLDELRRLQELEDACGCNCTKFNLFIPTSPDEEDDDRRLPQSQLLEELNKRGLLYDSVKKLSRSDQERILFKRIKTEPCCWSEDCPCVKNGIECQFDSCSCWKTATMRGMTPEKAKAKCGNPNGLHIIVMSKIKKHRRTTLRDVEEKRQEDEKVSLENFKKFILPKLIPKLDTIVIAVAVIYFIYIVMNRKSSDEEPVEL